MFENLCHRGSRQLWGVIWCEIDMNRSFFFNYFTLFSPWVWKRLSQRLRSLQYNTMSPSCHASPMVVSLFPVKLSGWQSVWPQLREVQAITLKSLFQLSLVWSNADHNGGGYDLNWVALCSFARQRKQKPTLNSPSRQPRVAIAPPGLEDEDWKLQTPEWFNMCLDFNGMQILQPYDDRSFQSQSLSESEQPKTRVNPHLMEGFDQSPVCSTISGS